MYICSTFMVGYLVIYVIHARSNSVLYYILSCEFVYSAPKSSLIQHLNVMPYSWTPFYPLCDYMKIS